MSTLALQNNVVLLMCAVLVLVILHNSHGALLTLLQAPFSSDAEPSTQLSHQG